MSRKKSSNFFYLVLEEIFYYTANPFFESGSVLPVFIDMLTNNMNLAALASTLRNLLFIIPQIMMGYYAFKIKKYPRFMTYASLFFRLFIFVFLFIYFIYDVSLQTVIGFLLLCSFLGLADGIINVPWLDLIGGSIRESDRGKLFSYILFLGGLGGALAGIIIKSILHNAILLTQTIFLIIFGLGGLFFILSSLTFAKMEDYQRGKKAPEESFIVFLKKMPQYFMANKNYIYVMITLILNYSSFLALPLYIVFARRLMVLDDYSIGILISYQVLGTVIGGGMWGLISYYFTNRLSIQTVVITNILIPILSLFAFVPGLNMLHFTLWKIICFASGAAIVGWPGFMNYIISIVPDNKRAVYIGMTNTISLPLTFLTLLGSLLANYYSIRFVLILVVFFCFLAFLFSFVLEKR
ncbi:MAG: MFS transporter [Firmicutes bacterium]|nr:MFS transporter [Bacillota bacterium]